MTEGWRGIAYSHLRLADDFFTFKNQSRTTNIHLKTGRLELRKGSDANTSNTTVMIEDDTSI